MPELEEKNEHEGDKDREIESQYRYPSCQPGKSKRIAFENMEDQLPPEWRKPEW